MTDKSKELRVWCDSCWNKYYYTASVVRPVAAGVVTLRMLEEALSLPAFTQIFTEYENKEAAAIAFLNQHGPACCLLGAERVQQAARRSRRKRDTFDKHSREY